MNKKSIAIIAVLAASVLIVVAITNPLVYASTESETETEQELRQKNMGGGRLTDDNCGQNVIASDYGITTCAVATITD